MTGRGKRCEADLAGLEGCQAPPKWRVRQALSLTGNAGVEQAACGRHLARVCDQVYAIPGGPYSLVLTPCEPAGDAR